MGECPLCKGELNVEFTLTDSPPYLAIGDKAVVLSRQEYLVMELFHTRTGVTIDRILDSWYGDLPDCDWPSDPRRCIYVTLHRLRKKLAPLGFEIMSNKRHRSRTWFLKKV